MKTFSDTQVTSFLTGSIIIGIIGFVCNFFIFTFPSTQARIGALEVKYINSMEDVSEMKLDVKEIKSDIKNLIRGKR